jgi:hypothetical protein
MTMTAVVGLFDVEQLKRRQEVARRRSALPPSNGNSQPLPFPRIQIGLMASLNSSPSTGTP